MGGSMHLLDLQRGFIGSVPIVGGTVPLAVGAGFAARLDARGDVAVAYFGDGTIEEGVVHESLNLASRFKLPVLFVCENNLFSSHLHIGLRQPADSVARFAEAHCIAFETVDGNDVVEVERAAQRLIARSRAGEGPGFLEAVTYRWRGHVGPREDVDVGVNRSGDLANWKKRDPLSRLTSAMTAAGLLSEDELTKLMQQVQAEVDEAWAQAEVAAYPDTSALMDCVYSS
jgi:acetoin:2,6-dichlorophenolindophenol oxidoreductase subunit alpha